MGQPDARVGTSDGDEQGSEGGDPSSLPMRVGLLEEDFRDVLKHTDKLDRYVNDMLKDLLGKLGQGQCLTDPLSSLPGRAAWHLKPCDDLLFWPMLSSLPVLVEVVAHLLQSLLGTLQDDCKSHAARQQLALCVCLGDFTSIPCINGLSLA